MPSIVSTGQITIVDNNDARPLTAFISITPSPQQIYTKDESTVTFTPNWTTENSNTGIELVARVYAGRTGTSEDVTYALTGKRWSYSLDPAAAHTITTGAASTAYWNESSATAGTAGYISVIDDATNGVRLRIRANLKPETPPLTIYFSGTYTDPITKLASTVIASIVLSQVKTGTNAVFIQLRTPDGTVLEPGHPSAPKNNVRVIADLMRAAGVDDTNVTYKWFESPHAAANQIDGNLSGVATKYGLMDTAAANANRTATIGQYATGTGTATAAITTTNVPDGAYGNCKGIVINHSAVSDIGVFKVEARDNDGKTYQTFFTIYDISDPYEVKLTSSGGDKLQNGVGSTDVYPSVYYGEAKVTNLTGWTFDWEFYGVDSVGNTVRGAFVDAGRTALSGGRSVTTNTARDATANTGTLTYSGAQITFAAGDIVKCVKGAAVELFEVASATYDTITSTGVITVRVPSVNTWIANNVASLTADKFKDGKIFVGLATRTTNGANNNDPAAKITLTGDDIDGKGTVTCKANKP